MCGLDSCAGGQSAVASGYLEVVSSVNTDLVLTPWMFWKATSCLLVD